MDGLPAASSSCSSFTAATQQQQQHVQQQQQQTQQHLQQQSLVGSPASGGGCCLGVVSAATATTAAASGGCSGSGGVLVLNSNSGGNSPRLGDAALSSLAASPTDACSIRSNPSAASLMANEMMASGCTGVTSGICGGLGSTATLSPLSSSAAAHHLMRRPSITMCV